jgi:ParB-like nuclease domain
MMILKKDPEEESTEQKAEETKDVETTQATPEIQTPVDPAVASPEEAIPPMTGPTTPPAPTGQEAAASDQGTFPSTPAAAGTESPDAGMPAEESVPPREFCYLSVDDILIEEQIRSSIDKKSESFRALMASIQKNGVLQPVLVTRRDDKYLLIAGERRLRACQQMNIPTIPARILAGITTGEDRIGDQLIENLQRGGRQTRHE